MIIKYCEYCKQTFEFATFRHYGSHKGTCKHNPKKQLTLKKLADAKKLKRKIIKKICEKCGTYFTVERKLSKDGKEIIPKKEKRFCRRKCANSCGGNAVSGKKIIICAICNEQFNVDKRNSKTKICVNCKYINIQKRNHKKTFTKTMHLQLFRINKKKYYLRQKYKALCQFSFNVFDYPNEFCLDLIQQYGFYKAKNHGDNLSGVSRDHMYSIYDGYKNNIDYRIIKHPANCQLLLQAQNAKKNSKSSVNIDELYQRIKLWNEKYNQILLASYGYLQNLI